MGKEQDTKPQSDFINPSQATPGETRDGISRADGQDPYDLAEVIYVAEVERLQQAGDLRRPSEIITEEEQDDHFDDLSRLYRQTCREMGLPWPPPAID